VPQARAERFVRWAQRFTRSGLGVPLRTRTAAHVRAFLSDLAQQTNVEPWRVDQAQEAPRVLYQECLPLPWARPWPFNAHTIEAAEGLSQRKIFRDEVSPHEKEYLEFLAEERQVAASTQNQALNALVFLYEQVLGEPLGTIGDFTRAKRPRHLPVVLTREEVNGSLEALPSAHLLMTGLLYGGGLRLMECARPRVKDVDFAQDQIVVRDGKGQKDRVSILPLFSNRFEST
jgi:hypothetical protein